MADIVSIAKSITSFGLIPIASIFSLSLSLPVSPARREAEYESPT